MKRNHHPHRGASSTFAISNPQAIAVMINILLFLIAVSVQADTPTGRYTIATPTVFDNKTGLTWQQMTPIVGGTSNDGMYTWSQAKAYCAALTLNVTGWRLPTVKELLTLVDWTKINPSIDTQAFPSTPPDAFWTATPAAILGTGWYVQFSNGFNDTSTLVTTTARVRCVR